MYNKHPQENNKIENISSMILEQISLTREYFAQKKRSKNQELKDTGEKQDYQDMNLIDGMKENLSKQSTLRKLHFLKDSQAIGQQNRITKRKNMDQIVLNLRNLNINESTSLCDCSNQSQRQKERDGPFQLKSYQIDAVKLIRNRLVRKFKQNFRFFVSQLYSQKSIILKSNRGILFNNYNFILKGQQEYNTSRTKYESKLKELVLVNSNSQDLSKSELSFNLSQTYLKSQTFQGTDQPIGNEQSQCSESNSKNKNSKLLKSVFSNSKKCTGLVKDKETINISDLLRSHSQSKSISAFQNKSNLQNKATIQQNCFKKKSSTLIRQPTFAQSTFQQQNIQQLHDTPQFDNQDSLKQHEIEINEFQSKESGQKHFKKKRSSLKPPIYQGANSSSKKHHRPRSTQNQPINTKEFTISFARQKFDFERKHIENNEFSQSSSRKKRFEKLEDFQKQQFANFNKLRENLIQEFTTGSLVQSNENSLKKKRNDVIQQLKDTIEEIQYQKSQDSQMFQKQEAIGVQRLLKIFYKIAQRKLKKAFQAIQIHILELKINGLLESKKAKKLQQKKQPVYFKKNLRTDRSNEIFIQNQQITTKDSEILEMIQDVQSGRREYMGTQNYENTEEDYEENNEDDLNDEEDVNEGDVAAQCKIFLELLFFKLGMVIRYLGCNVKLRLLDVC